MYFKNTLGHNFFDIKFLEKYIHFFLLSLLLGMDNTYEAESLSLKHGNCEY